MILPDLTPSIICKKNYVCEELSFFLKAVLLLFRVEQVDPEEGGGIDWSSEVDRLMVIKMIMKMADISTPTKSYELHRAWTKLITEEFYQQVCNFITCSMCPMCVVC